MDQLMYKIIINESSLTILGFVFFFTPFIIASYYTLKAQAHFLAMYSKKSGAKKSEIRDEHDKKSDFAVASSYISVTNPLSPQLFKAIWTKYSNHDLNQAAVKVRKHIAILFIVMIADTAAAVYFFSLAEKFR